MKHATGTCLIVIVEKGLFFAYTCIFKKIFALRIKRLFELLSRDQYFKGRNIHGRTFKIG